MKYLPPFLPDFFDYEVSILPRKGGYGWRSVYKFDNGYSASIVQSKGSYGSEDRLWELAVLDSTGDLTYITPITNDVLGYQTEEDLNRVLAEIKALPKIKD